VWRLDDEETAILLQDLVACAAVVAAIEAERDQRVSDAHRPDGDRVDVGWQPRADQGQLVE